MQLVQRPVDSSSFSFAAGEDVSSANPKSVTTTAGSSRRRRTRPTPVTKPASWSLEPGECRMKRGQGRNL
jgi:hypothetical protein